MFTARTYSPRPIAWRASSTCANAKAENNNNAHAMCVTREQVFYGDQYSYNRFRPSRLGAGLAAMERLHADGALSLSVFLGAFTLVLSLAIVLPTAGYVLQSRHRYGHWGTRPIAKRCRNV